MNAKIHMYADASDEAKKAARVLQELFDSHSRGTAKESVVRAQLAEQIPGRDLAVDLALARRDIALARLDLFNKTGVLPEDKIAGGAHEPSQKYPMKISVEDV